jgi:hypothetical protein
MEGLGEAITSHQWMKTYEEDEDKQDFDIECC